MSGFSAEWLTLREAADHRARDAFLAMSVADHLQGRTSVDVIDLGCGTGSNIRAAYALFGSRQRWTLVDYDARLLRAARGQLMAWADGVVADGDRLAITKSGKTLEVGFRQADLATGLEPVLAGPCDLVTASALFDLCSTAFIERMAKAVAARRAAFYTVLTYNGIQRWTPPHRADAAMLEAFHGHQMSDKGFGPSAGPRAPAALASAFTSAGYTVREGDSPWLLGRPDQTLIDALVPGFAGAVRETGRVPEADVADWLAVERRGSEVGHTDTFAAPAA